MELSDYLNVLVTRWRSILLVVLVGAAAAAAVIAATPVQYRATTNTLLMVIQGNNPGELVSGSSFSQSQADSFASIATSARVLQPAMEHVGVREPIETFAGRVYAQVPAGTVIVSVSATADTPELAARIADAVADELCQAVEDMTPSAKDGTKLVKATVIAPALLPREPSAPSVKRLLGAGLALGLLLGYGQALIRLFIGRQVRTERDVQAVGAPLIAQAQFDPLRLLGFGRGRLAIAVTAATGGEGTTTMAIELAMQIAQQDHKVLLMDANLRRPALALRLGVDADAGLSDVLSGRVELERAVRHTRVEQVDVLPAGPASDDPAGLLGGPALDELVHTALRSWDYVIVDTPPILSSEETPALVRALCETVIVAVAGHTTRRQLRRAAAAVQAAPGHVCGVMLNRTHAEQFQLP